jgi:hypothetical protein
MAEEMFQIEKIMPKSTPGPQNTKERRTTAKDSPIASYIKFDL